jgi:putative cardiolipin synthase
MRRSPFSTERLRSVFFLAFMLLISACAGLPAKVERPVSMTLVAPPDAPLVAMATALAVPADRSAVRPLVFPDLALEARLDLMRRARVSIDVQTYLIGNDPIGRMVLRELRNAALRGVRVRLLLDDLYAVGMDDLLLGLAAHPGVEVRLFNPFAYGRDGWLPRLWHLATDLSRLNHRMHNKLFLADGVVAVAGGRNLADEYFMQSKAANFIDFDLQATGAIVSSLTRFFDDYWNNGRCFPIQALTHNGLDEAEQRRSFESLTAGDLAPAAKIGP